MPTKRDYYEVLGVDKDATGDEIKQAFRKLAFQCHPDHSSEERAEEKFKEINEAYQVLSDADKRAVYDRWGHAGPEGNIGAGFSDFGFGGLGDIFDAFFGGGTTATRNAPRRGNDLQYGLKIEFEEAAFGCEKEISISRIENCFICHGAGSKPDSKPSRCPACKGTGQVRHMQQSIFGRFTNITTCSQCHGEGRIITDPCPQCRGKGREKQQRTMKVTIPPGVDSGSQIRLSGQGEAGTRGGPPGDLYIVIKVKPHEIFIRDGDNIVYELPLDFAQAALGAEIEVPTIAGTTKLKIPAGSQTGQVFRLKAKGFPHVQARGIGDQLVVLVVFTPESLDKKQRQLLEELAESFTRENMPSSLKERSLLFRIKSVFGS
jgi:molecular chaperone DnaJ